MTYSDRIKELRKSLGMSQAEMGDRIGFSKATVGMWEAGNRRPTIDALDRMSQLFNRSVDYILGKEDNDEPQAAESDYTALSGLANDIYDLFKKYLYASPEGKEIIENTIRGVWNMCVQTETVLPDVYQPFSVSVGLKDKIVTEEQSASENCEQNREPAETDFLAFTDEEAAEIMKRFKK